MIETLSEAEIDDLLGRATFARLGCHFDGKTYVVPINYAYLNGCLYGYTSAGLKVDMMRQNPQVCVEVDEVNSLTDWKTAILWGSYEELTGAKAAEAAGFLIDRYGPEFQDSQIRRGREITPPRLDGRPEPAIVYCIHIAEKTGRRETPST